MRAVQVLELTGPDGVRVVELPEPETEGGVVIDVHAAGVSFPDLLLSQGRYQLKPDPPFTLGVEAAGVVREAPPGTFEPGQRVAAFAFGSFAETLVAPPEMTFPLADELNFEEGAGLVMNYQTAHFALKRRAALEEGETLLVHGAAGGVGMAAIQVGRGLGAHVIAVVSTDEKGRIAEEAGAHEIVATGEGWLEQVKGITGGRGVNVVFDPVGGERFQESIRCLAPEGRLLVIGFAEGEIPSVAANRLLFRNVTVMGAAWGQFLVQRPGSAREIGEDLKRMVAEGHVKPIVGEVYPFDRAADALRALEERRATGKIVLAVRGPGGVGAETAVPTEGE